MIDNTRPRLSALPFATVSVLTIYSTATIPHHHTNNNNNNTSASEPQAKEDEQTVEMNKVAFWHSQHQHLTVERKARLMGTIRGMADFARMLSSAGGEGVRSVHSLRQRMVWFEPEKGWTIHATIDLPRSPKHPRSPSSATDSSTSPPSTLPLDDNALIAALALAYAQYRLEHGSLQGLAEREGRAALMETLGPWWTKFAGRWQLESGEPGAFERTVGGLTESPLKTSASEQLDPLMSQFAATNSSAVPILLHRAAVLSLPTLAASPAPPALTRASSIVNSASDSVLTPSPTPSSRPARPPPPPLTEADLSALVRYLADRVPPALPPTAAPAATAATNTSASAPALASLAPASGSTKWYQRGLFEAPSLPSVPLPTMASMNMTMTMPALSMPAMPTVNMPNISMPSMTMPSMPGIPGLSSSPASQGALVGEKAAGSPARAGGGWGMRNVSWGTDWLKSGHKRSSSSLANAAKAGASEPGAVTEAVAEAPARQEVAEVARAEGAPQSPAAEGAGSEGGAGEIDTLALPDTAAVSNSVTPGSGARSPPTPAVKLDDDVDPIALAEAMASMEALAQLELVGGAGGDTGKELAMAALAVTQPGPPRAVRQVSWVYVGEGSDRDTSAELWTFQHGDLTLGLVTRPSAEGDAAGEGGATGWLESRSLRLLDAVESVTEGTSSPDRASPHQYLVKTGPLASAHGFTSGGGHWSGKESADDHDATAALFDTHRQATSHPAVLESFVRLASSQWVIRQKVEEPAVDGSGVEATEVYVALPAKVGKEGSLVDAAEELRRLKRAVGVPGA